MSARKESCQTCAAFDVIGSACRRKSPVMVPVPDPNPRNAGGVAAMGLYPATNKDQWCLEWIQDASRLN